MSTGQGTVVFDFGSAPGTNVVYTDVTDAGILTGDKVGIYLMGLDSTAGHNAYEHSILELGGLALSCISITNGVGFRAQAATMLRLTGTITAHYVRAS